MEPETTHNDLYGHAPAATEHSFHAPVSMVGTPTDMALSDHLGIAQQQADAGMAPDNHAATERAILQASQLADMMASQGASDDEIKQAIGSISGVTIDNHAAVQAAAMNTADAHKFSILGGTAKNDGQSKAEAPLTLGTILGAGEEKPAGEKYVLNDQEREGQLMSTTAAIAALEQFRPQAGLPIPQRQQGLQRA